MKLTKTERAYLAGLIDGEGCIAIVKRLRPAHKSPEYTLHIVIAQSNQSFLCLWQRKTSLGFVSPAGKNGSQRFIFQWRIGSRQAEELLRLVCEFLILKREQAEIALEFRESIWPRKAQLTIQEIEMREDWRFRISQLNGSTGKKSPLYAYGKANKKF
jgi:hypothetical protein